MATIYEVSKLAGVSLATVSRVMNKSSNVSEKTREKVTAAMEQLGYRPNAVAKSLASNRSNCIGILVSELHGPFYGAMMGGIESEFRVADKHIVVTASHAELEREKEDIDFLISRNCDALILHVEAVSDEYLINLSKGKTPIFIINRLVPGLEDNCICLDNELGGYMATRKILEAGHKDLVYISGPKWKADAQERLKGHHRALKEFNIEYSADREYFGNYLQTGGSAGIKHFIEKGQKFTAVVCANDEMATGAMATAREHDLHIPQDISVMGFDDVIFSSYTYPKLTTIKYPIWDMGVMAARMVMKLVYKQTQKPVKTLFDPDLIERESIRSITD